VRDHWLKGATTIINVCRGINRHIADGRTRGIRLGLVELTHHEITQLVRREVVGITDEVIAEAWRSPIAESPPVGRKTGKERR
jgi:hypothetical protein